MLSDPIGLCKICKGPIEQSDLTIPCENGVAHMSITTCDWHKEEIERADREFLAIMRIAAE